MKCPNCKNELFVNVEGDMYVCPSCGKKYRKKQAQDANKTYMNNESGVPKYNSNSNAETPNAAQEYQSEGSVLGGFLLGFILGLIGLIIAIAIGKQRTSKAAVGGFITEIVLGGIVGLLVFLLVLGG